ncbi:MAG: hypothetical protein IKL65_06440 [Bacilli bacterium]|nr:hypothetical protein [Bacilli bacterium]
MEKGRSSKVVAIVALCVAVVGLSLGFAAFTSNLTIKSSATVTPDDSTFNVAFSKVSGEVVNGAVSGVATTANGETAVLPTAADATIADVDGVSVISGLKATFTEPGQTVTYSFYAVNDGLYDAYLNTVEFENAVSAEGADLGSFKVCTPGATTDATMVTNACANINVSVQVGNDTFTVEDHALAAKHQLNKNASEEVVVTLTYTGTALADGDFEVAFGDINLTYDSVTTLQ